MTDTIVPQSLAAPEEAADAGTEVSAGGSAFRQFASTFAENKLAVAGVVIVVLIVLFSYFGPLVYHTNQSTTRLLDVNRGPGPGGPLGSDEQGRDILGRLMYGGRVSIEISLAVAAVVTIIGVLYGAIAGFFGKALDTVMMRVVDVGLSLPPVFLFIFVSRVITPSIPLLIAVLSATVWFVPARLIRGETLSLKTREYVLAAKGMGSSSARTILRHIIPNSIGTIIVNATFQVADAVIILALLEYLGFSLPPPTPTWGGMISDAITELQNGYWWEFYPALIIIVLTVCAFNFIGDGLRDSFDVRLQKR